MTAPIRIERARGEDLLDVLDVLSEAARWLRGRGIEQWPDPFPADRVTDALARGDVYLARERSRAIGTLTLEWSDAFFWGEQPPDAAYVHRMAVRREAAGLGRRLLDWAEGQAVAAGRAYLRLDCGRENDALRRYYEQAGFVHRGDVDGDGWPASLYERPCGW